MAETEPAGDVSDGEGGACACGRSAALVPCTRNGPCTQRVCVYCVMHQRRGTCGCGVYFERCGQIVTDDLGIVSFCVFKGSNLLYPATDITFKPSDGPCVTAMVKRSFRIDHAQVCEILLRRGFMFVSESPTPMQRAESKMARIRHEYQERTETLETDVIDGDTTSVRFRKRAHPETFFSIYGRGWRMTAEHTIFGSGKQYLNFAFKPNQVPRRVERQRILNYLVDRVLPEE